MADNRPDVSPYGGLSVRIEFGGGSLAVTEGVLEKWPKLLHALKDNGEDWDFGFPKKALQYIPIAAGHVIVHYLFTGTYESLRPIGTSPEEKYIAELTTAIQVYINAHIHEIQPLKELAGREMECFSKFLSPIEVLRIIKDQYTDPDLNDLWFANYVKQQIQSLSETPELLLGSAILESIVGDEQVTKFILKATFSVFHGLMGSMKATTTALEPATATSPVRDFSPTWERVPPEESAIETVYADYSSIKISNPVPISHSDLAETKAASELSPELLPGNDDFSWWAFPSKKSKKDKKRASNLEPVLEPAHEPELEPQPLQEAGPAPESGLEPARDFEDFCRPSKTKKEKKKKKKKISFYSWEPENAPEPQPESVPEPGLPSEAEPAPAAEEDVNEIPPPAEEEPGTESFWGRFEGDHKSRNINVSDTSCDARAEHILDGKAWKQCPNCYEFVRVCASQLG